MVAGAGNAFRQNNADFIDEAALVRTFRQVVARKALSTRAFYQIPNLKIKFISFDCHAVKPYLELLNKNTICFCLLSRRI